MKKTFVVCFILVCFTLFSCAGLEEHRGATTGGAIGAGLGGLIGAAVAPKGKGLEGAIIGGLAGALAGGLVGHYAYDKSRTQSATNQYYGYNGEGVSVRVENLDVKPKNVNPGGKIDTYGTYAVLTPTGQSVKVREIREIYYNNSLWGNPETTMDRMGGTYRSNVPIFMPNDAPKGTYTIRYIVETDYGRDSRDATFQVQ